MPIDSDPLEPAIQEGEPPVRVIQADATEWRVYEQPPVYDRRRRPDLVFESEGVIRRVRNYPTNWLDLTDDELIAVSWER
jgi:hypothetical protein